jgi:hypothetical protein
MLKVRRVEESDRDLLDKAARSDPFHAAVGLTGQHWAGKDTLFYEDELGPVVALKTTNVVRVDVQFLTQEKTRNARALVAGFYSYVGILQKRGVKEIVFNTESPEVAEFFINRFHFRQLNTSSNYSLWIGD